MKVGQEIRNNIWGNFSVQSSGAVQFFRVAKISGSRNEVEVSSWALGLLFYSKFLGLGAYILIKLKKSYQKAIFFPSFLSIADFT